MIVVEYIKAQHYYLLKYLFKTNQEKLRLRMKPLSATTRNPRLFASRQGTREVIHNRLIQLSKHMTSILKRDHNKYELR